MAAVQQLRNPPITEAVIDIRATFQRAEDAVKVISTTLSKEFPKVRDIRTFTASLNVVDGKIAPPKEAAVSRAGIIRFSPDDSLAVQFRNDGFSMNNMKKYIGGDRLIDQALRVWGDFASQAQVIEVSQVAFRHINKLALPLRPGDEFSKFLTAAPVTPPEAPQSIAEFLTRMVISDNPDTESVTVVQQLTHEGSVPSLLIDVNAVRGGGLTVEPAALRETFEHLRQLSDRVFFSLLTEETVTLYL